VGEVEAELLAVDARCTAVGAVARVVDGKARVAADGMGFECALGEEHQRMRMREVWVG
jgi:hypothetical protein